VPVRETRIVNKLGMHARAAARFVTTASAFRSDIHMSAGEREVNGKSIMALLMLAASNGTQVCLRAEGPDADAALSALIDLIDDRFGEDQ
jgi:phosphocarrier protein